MTDTEKHLSIMTMKLVIEEAMAAAGVNSLADIETAISNLDAAFQADPVNVTAAALDAVHDQVAALSLLSMINLVRVWRNIQDDAGTPSSVPIFDGSWLFDGGTVIV